MYKVQGGLGGLCKALEMYESKGDCAVLTSKNIQKAGCLESRASRSAKHAQQSSAALRSPAGMCPPRRHPFDTI